VKALKFEEIYVCLCITWYNKWYLYYTVANFK